MASDPTAERLRSQATALSIGRALFGAGAVIAPRLAGRIVGYPAEEITPSTVVIARLFGIRELALAAVTADAVRREPRRVATYTLNAAVDAGDAAACLVALGAKGRFDRALIGSAVLAMPFLFLWLRMRQEAAAAPA